MWLVEEFSETESTKRKHQRAKENGHRGGPYIAVKRNMIHPRHHANGFGAVKWNCPAANQKPCGINGQLAQSKG